MKDIRTQVEERTPQIKGFATSMLVSEIPNTPEKAVCQKHGEFEFRYMDHPFGGKHIQNSTCIDCINERNAFIDAEVARITIEEDEERIHKKILSSGVSKRNADKTFSSFIAETQEQTKAKAMYEEFAYSVCNGLPVKNLIVCGSVGVGKTHLASSTVNSIIKGKKDCRLVKIIDLIRGFKNSWSKDTDYTEQEFLDFHTNVDALIIDEVGVQFGSDTEKMIVFDIIDGRYNNMLPTILISNLALPDVKELIGDRAIDRLREDGGVVVAMKWKSHRIKS